MQRDLKGYADAEPHRGLPVHTATVMRIRFRTLTPLLKTKALIFIAVTGEYPAEHYDHQEDQGPDQDELLKPRRQFAPERGNDRRADKPQEKDSDDCTPQHERLQSGRNQVLASAAAPAPASRLKSWAPSARTLDGLHPAHPDDSAELFGFSR